MREERWIGSKYYGKLWQDCKWIGGKVLQKSYLLSVWRFETCDGVLYEHHVEIKEYRFKQSAVRYIKNNF